MEPRTDRIKPRCGYEGNAWLSDEAAIIVAPLLHSHLEQVLEIERLSFDSTIRESTAVYQKRIETFPEGSLGFFHENQLIGFFWCELWEYRQQHDPEEFTLSHDPVCFRQADATELYISSFAVDPRMRHMLRGRHAFALGMAHVCRTWQPRHAILLVSDHWVAAKRIYSDYGFTETQRLPRFFTHDRDVLCDGMVMRWCVGDGVFPQPERQSTGIARLQTRSIMDAR